MGDARRVLMVYLEPAPYIVGLIDEIRSIWAGEIEVAFVHAAISQPWGYEFRGPAESELPPGTLKALRHISQVLANGRCSLIHLAGWGGPILLGTLLLGAWRRVPVTVETDTPAVQGLPLWKRVIKALVYRLIFKLPAMFLPGGSRQAAYLRHYGVEERRIQIARMTVDVSKIISYSESMQHGSKSSALLRYGIPENRVIILYLGRLEPHKGLFDLLEAFNFLVDCRRGKFSRLGEAARVVGAVHLLCRTLVWRARLGGIFNLGHLRPAVAFRAMGVGRERSDGLRLACDCHRSCGLRG